MKKCFKCNIKKSLKDFYAHPEMPDGHVNKCEICNSVKVVAHHDDYLKPLEVRWMCQAHHKQWHVKNGEGLNKR